MVPAFIRAQGRRTRLRRRWISAIDDAQTSTGQASRSVLTVKITLDPMPVSTPRVIFDISRLIRRSIKSFATGVDRVDLIVGTNLAAQFKENCSFVHAGPLGPALLPYGVGTRMLAAIAAHWHGNPASLPPLAMALTRGMARLKLGGIDRPEDVTYVVASHSGLALRPGYLTRLDPSRRMRRLGYIYDLIPLEFPEYQRPESAATFRAFLEQLADGPIDFVTISTDTSERLRAHAAANGWTAGRIEPRVPRLADIQTLDKASGVTRPALKALLADPRPYFLMLSTIEPRKNHLLILHVWRTLAAEGIAPRLVVAGRRGWENEMVLDMLERCVAIRDHVVEFGDLTDAEITQLMRHARALLMPSFAEGLGLPVLEAGAFGLPAIVSDLAALREVAAPGTVFLDPLDAPAWRRAILAAASR